MEEGSQNVSDGNSRRFEDRKGSLPLDFCDLRGEKPKYTLPDLTPVAEGKFQSMLLVITRRDGLTGIWWPMQ